MGSGSTCLALLGRRHSNLERGRRFRSDVQLLGLRQRSSLALHLLGTGRHHLDMLGSVQGRRAGAILTSTTSTVCRLASAGLVALGSALHLDAQPRQWLPTPVEADVWEDADGTLLGARPLQIVRSPRGGLVVTDWADFSIRELSAAGEVIWKFGRNGPGPGEFLAFMDLQFALNGDLRVLDPRNRRITVVGPTGQLVQTVPLWGGEAAALLPESIDPGYYPLVPHTNKKDTLWASYSADGVQHRVVDMPMAVGFDHDLTGEGWATEIPGGRSLVFFRWSSQMIILGATGNVAAVAEGVEPIPFPKVVLIERSGPGWTARGFKVDPQAVRAATGATATASRIFVLFLGATGDAGRVVDTYSSRDGSYLGSYRFPHRIDAVTVLMDGRLATLENRLLPTIRLWNLPVGG